MMNQSEPTERHLDEARIIERAGSPIHYWIDAAIDARPTIILTHGAGADHHMFDGQLAALRGVCRLLTWDVRGHGLSRPMGEGFSLALVAEDLLAIMDREGLGRVILLGQSMGGNLSQLFVAAHPERVQALILVDCVCNTASLNAIERWLVTLTPAILRLYPMETLLKQSAQVAAIKPMVRQYLYHAMKQLTKDEIGLVLMETTLSLRDDPAFRIPRPFLLIRGQHDNAGAIKKQMSAWAAREPNCRGEIVIPDAGHCANQDNPAVFNQHVLAFLQAESRSG